MEPAVPSDRIRSIVDVYRSSHGHRDHSRHRPRALPRRRAGGARPHGQGAAVRADGDRLLLHRQSRRAAGQDPGDLRRGEALPRAAGRQEARPQDRPAQHGLHADARQHAAHLDGAVGHQAQPQRGLLREARDGGRPSRRAGQPPLPWPQPLARRPARLPRDRGRLLQHHGSAGAEDGAPLRPRARPAGRVFRRAVPRLPVFAAHDALPAPGRAHRGRVRPGPAHRHQLPDPAGAQRRAGPLHPHAERQVDRCAGDCRRLCRERRPDAAALDQRCLPGDAASRRQPQRRRALRHPVLLRQQHRLAGRRGADRPWDRTSRPSTRRPTTATTWSGTRSGTTTCSTTPTGKRPSERHGNHSHRRPGSLPRRGTRGAASARPASCASRSPRSASISSSITACPRR